MAVDFTGTTIPGPTITGTTSGAPGNNALAAQVVKTTFDKVIAFKSRTEPMLRKFATKRPVDVAYPGSTIDMFIDGADLALATTPLGEYADPDFVPLPAPTKVTLPLNEYGNATVTTLRLREFSWSQINPLQAVKVGRNMSDTLDKLVETELLTGANKYYPAKTGGAIAAGAAAYDAAGEINSGVIRRIVAKMRKDNAIEWDGGTYYGILHPDVCVDLREETDAAGWRLSHEFDNANSFFWDGEVGVYEGVRWVEYNRAPVAVQTKSGDPDIDLYTSFIFAQDALAEAVAVEASTVVTPNTDKFGRLLGVGWYFFGGWKLYRPEALSLLQTTASTTV